MRRSSAVVICAAVISVATVFQARAYSRPETPSKADLMKGASITESEGISYLHLKGTPYQMGYQHGVLLKEKIHYLYDQYLVNFLKEKTGKGLKFWIAYKVFRDNAARMDRYIPDDFRKELKGIADGSGMTYNQVLIMHTFLDVVSHPKIVKKPVLSCTNFMTMSSASSGGKLIHGRNLSWPSKGLLDKNSTVVFYEPANGNKFCAISWPGICGVLTGMNEKGVTLGETSVGTAESSLDGVPAFILLRDALQYSDTMYDVIRHIGASRRTTGYTVGVADGKLKRACVIECTDKRYAVRFPKDDYLICANHYLDQALFDTMKSVYPGLSLSDTNTYKRMDRMTELIKKHYGKVDRGLAEKFLSDSVMNTPGTFLSVVFEPEKLQMSLAIGHDDIAAGKFFSLDLKRELRLNAPAMVTPDPEKFFSYTRAEIPEQRKLARQEKNYRLYQVTIPSGVHSTFFDNNVYLNYYEPKGGKGFPVIIILPHFTGSKSQIEGKFAEKFANEGMGAVVIDMAFQKNGRAWLAKQLKQGDLATLENLFREIIVDCRRTIDWLETQPGIDNSRIGVMGISLGAIAAPVVCGNDTRVKAAAYILGGGDLPTIIYNAEEADFFKKRLEEKKISVVDFRNRFAIIDPLTYAYKAKQVPAVMYNAMFDRLIPRRSTMELWNALQNPKLFMYPGGHYSTILFLPDVRGRVTRHFKNCFNGAGEMSVIKTPPVPPPVPAVTPGRPGARKAEPKELSRAG
ncbi:MAG: C45 family autoproteolytic acyltransferase/hydrolase [Deltaproteobacteria bacterium]